MQAMERHILIAIFIAIVSSSLAEEAPCSVNGCSNFTLYMGPRWGSKLIVHPNYPKLKGPGEEEVEQQLGSSSTYNKRLLNQVSSDDSDVPGTVVSAHHRPVPDDNSFHIDYGDTPARDQESISIRSSNYTFKIGNVNELFVQGTLNLGNLGIQVEDLKAILTSLSTEIQEGLHCLNVSNNPLDKHNDRGLLLQLSHLSNLKVLDVSKASIGALISIDHPSLEVLNLSNNLLSHMPNLNTPNLRELDLSGNNLNAFMYSLSHLRNLQILSLADNDMFIMSPEALIFLNLQKLYLNNNKFHVIYQITLDPNTSPNVSLYLSGNPLECDCYLQEDLLNRAFPRIADWDQLTCKDHFDSEPRLITDVADQCQSFMSWLKVLPDRLDSGWNKLHFFLRRLGVSSPDDFIIYSVLLFAILLLLLALRLRTRRLKKDHMVSSSKITMPYSVLDNKHVPLTV